MLSLNPTVFLVDPDAAARGSLEAVIRRAGCTNETLGSAGSLLTRPPFPVPSCLVLDISLLDLGGFDLLRRLATERKETPIIAIASHGDIPMIVRAMKAGAVEFLMKPLTDAALLPAIRYALAQSRAVLDQMAVLRELRNRYDSLSAREREVMARVAAGDMNKRIGAALGISEITVKAHRSKVMGKMRAESVAELVGMALRLELAAVPTTTPPTVRSVQWQWQDAPNATRSTSHARIRCRPLIPTHGARHASRRRHLMALGQTRG
jgi:FixJ family two-component response regulator